MSYGERIKQVRRALHLTLEKFGGRLGVTKTAISNLENSSRNLTDQMAKAICREFNVNYEWLMTGDGPMFSELPASVLEELCKVYGLDAFDRSLIAEYLRMDPEDRQVLKGYIRRVLLPLSSADAGQDDIDAEVAAYRRALELEKEQAEESSVSGAS